jgi:hypothetical protein
LKRRESEVTQQREQSESEREEKLRARHRQELNDCNAYLKRQEDELARREAARKVHLKKRSEIIQKYLFEKVSQTSK